MYKRLGTTEQGNPVIFNHRRGTVVETSQQIAKHLLCSDCEQLLCRNGEDEVLRWYSVSEQVFPLRDALQTEQPIRLDEGMRRYGEHQLPPEMPAAPLKYFALSVVWRGSVEQWLPQGQHTYFGALGKQYEEIFRQFLLGECSLPKVVSFTVGVDFSIPTAELAYFPSVRTERTPLGILHSHTFYIPGLRFMVLIGDPIGMIDNLESVWPLFYEQKDILSAPSHAFVRHVVASATPKGKLAKIEQDQNDWP